MSIAACMMVHCPNKRHEVFFRKALASLEGLVDQVCVVNAKSGENDRTREILEEWALHQPDMRIKFLAETWQKDFSLHRNQSLDLADDDMDWLLVLDSDDVLKWMGKKNPAKRGAHLRAWLKELPADLEAVGLHVVLKNWRAPDIHQNQPRLFRQGRVRYQRRVHNYPVFKGTPALCPLLMVEHEGYGVPPAEMALRLKRSQELLQQSYDQGDDPQDAFFLGQLVGLQGQEKKARELLTEYLEKEDYIPPDKFNTSVYASLIDYHLKAGEIKEARELLARGLKRHPANLDLNYYLSDYGAHSGNLDAVLQGGQQYVVLYRALLQDPSAQDAGFCFTLNQHHFDLTQARLACVYALEAEAICKRLDQNCSPQVARMIKDNLARLGLESWAPEPISHKTKNGEKKDDSFGAQRRRRKNAGADPRQGRRGKPLPETLHQ